MKIHRWLPCLAGALLAATLVIPVDGSAQTKLEVGLSPFTSHAGVRSVIRSIPTQDGQRGLVMATGRTLGVALDLGLDGLPLRLRSGASYAHGSLRYALSMRESLASQRAWPDGGSYLMRENVASGTVLTYWADLVVEPFNSRLSPYGVAGVTRRQTSYEGLPTGVDPYVGDTETEALYRLGLGLDFDLSDRSSFWIEAVRHYAAPGATGLHGYQPLGDPGFLVGLRFGLF